MNATRVARATAGVTLTKGILGEGCSHWDSAYLPKGPQHREGRHAGILFGLSLAPGPPWSASMKTTPALPNAR
jgi:hypothetical protein